MATAILDLEFSELLPEITLEERYSKALILIRLDGKPLGQALLPVVGGRIGGEELRETLRNAGGDPLWKSWLYDILEWDERGPLERNAARHSSSLHARSTGRFAALSRRADVAARRRSGIRGN